MPKLMLPSVPLGATSENLAADLRRVGVMVISVSIERESRKAIVEYAEVASRSSSAKNEAPEFVELSVQDEILVTGIKVVDLLEPYK